MINQIARDVVDVFEDLLERHNIIIPDGDRPDDNNSPLYGCTYADLLEDVTYVISAGMTSRE